MGFKMVIVPPNAPPAGYYYKELIESDVVVTNQREIYNDHLSTHIMAFILAFARGLQGIALDEADGVFDQHRTRSVRRS